MVDFASDAKTSNYWMNRVRRVAKQFPKFAFVTVPASSPELDAYGLSGERAAFAVVVEDKAKAEKYVMAEPWTPGKDDVAPLKTFLDEVAKGTYYAYVKSQPVMAHNPDGAQQVVGLDFKAKVADADGQDVMIEFYAPWRARALAPHSRARTHHVRASGGLNGRGGAGVVGRALQVAGAPHTRARASTRARHVAGNGV